MNERIERVRTLIEGPFLVTKPVNVRYLTGLDSSNATLLVESDRERLFTDFRYREKALKLGLEVVEIPRSLFGELPSHLPPRVEFEAETLTYASWAALQAAGIELVPRSELIEGVRAAKEPAELDAIRAAAAITDESFARLAEQRFTGRTEKEVAWWLESVMHELGADGTAFDVIVAAGTNGSSPHADTGDRVIEPDTLVTVDAGATLDGYYSDCTRTFATGAVPEELARSYEVCLGAQKAALAEVRAGAAGAAVDAVARELIAAEGLGELFGHGLGHGVGMEIHELPRLRPESADVLPAGGVCTVEPGIYHPGLGGIRIEDLVIVGEDGPEILSPFTKELVTVA